MTTYRVVQAALGHCIVMRDDDGNDTVIETGITAKPCDKDLS